MNKYSGFTQANRMAWNNVMPKHQLARQNGYYNDFFLQDKEIPFLQKECHVLNGLKCNINGKRVAHLCCNNGLELLAFKKFGASYCVGFDICDLAIEEAVERSHKYNLEDVVFIQGDIYEIDEEYNNSFDIIYISVGTLRWLPDLNLFFSIANWLLKKGGILFLRDIHPLAEIMNDDRIPMEPALIVINSYFNNNAHSDDNSLDYIGHTNEKGMIKYWFVHTLSSIITGVINIDHRIVFFEESQEDISDVYQLIESQQAKIPLSFILVSQK